MTPAEAARLMRRATLAAITVATALIVAKTVAWVMTGSVSLLASLIDSILDALASLVNLLAVRHALSPADREHRFGHGKAEALAGLGQAAFVAGSAGFLMLEAGRRVLHPAAAEATGVGIAVMLLSIAVTLGLVMYQRYVVKRTDSTAISADALHYRGDLLANAGVILALWLSARGLPGVDPLIAIAIALYILFNAWHILRQSLDHLMDRELPNEERERIIELVLSHPNVLGMHDLRSRRAGIVTFVQLHLELEDDLSLIEAHRISEAVEATLRKAYEGAEIIIHPDPLSVISPERMRDFDDLSQKA
ncbi:MAG: cation diffusion facilitator family transporter [Halioglobus sp.]|nr:cation diffusion facilitator family transporter [Halioglobus sp.]